MLSRIFSPDQMTKKKYTDLLYIDSSAEGTIPEILQELISDDLKNNY